MNFDRAFASRSAGSVAPHWKLMTMVVGSRGGGGGWGGGGDYNRCKRRQQTMPAIFAFDGRGTTVALVVAVVMGDDHLLALLILTLIYQQHSLSALVQVTIEKCVLCYYGTILPSFYSNFPVSLL